MMDETTDRSTTIKVIIYIKYLDKDKNGTWTTMIDYLDLVTPSSQSAINIKVISFHLTLLMT